MGVDLSNLQNKTRLVTDQAAQVDMRLVSDQAGKRSVADTLTRLGMSYEYEEKLLNKDDNPLDYRLPDFTVSYEGDTYFWEHLGMLSVPSYKEKWDCGSVSGPPLKLLTVD